MSQADVELVRAGVEALNETYATGDIGPWAEHVRRAFDPEVVLEGSASGFTEGEWRGHQGAIDFVANQMDVLDDMWLKADEISEPLEGRLAVSIRFGGRARHTGITVELSPVHVLDLRDGKALRWRVFGDRDEGLRAAGFER